jgi:hypothetical protein
MKSLGSLPFQAHLRLVWKLFPPIVVVCVPLFSTIGREGGRLTLKEYFREIA